MKSCFLLLLLVSCGGSSPGENEGIPQVENVKFEESKISAKEEKTQKKSFEDELKQVGRELSEDENLHLQENSLNSEAMRLAREKLNTELAREINFDE